MKRFRTALLASLGTALVLALGGLALPLSQYSTTAASNGTGVTGTVPDGAPENWTGSQINDTVRQFMAVVRTWYNDPQWLEITYDLSPRGTKTLTRVDADTLDVVGTNATAYFTAGRRIQIVGSSTVTCYVVSSALNGSDTRIEVGTSCSVPTSPTAVNVYFGSDLRSAAFSSTGSGNGLDADTVDTNHGTALAQGLFDGRIVYATAATVTIERGYASSIRAEIDGVILTGSSDLTIDLSNVTDREDVSEASSTWYYLYLYSNSGTLTEKISSTAPNMTAGTKVGYHPTNTGWRCIGAVFNNASSNIQPFDYHADSGLWTFRSIVAAFTKSPGTAQQSSYATVSLSGNVPATARTVRLNAVVQQENAKYYYGHESLSGTVSTTPAVNYILVDIESSNNNPTGSLQFEIAVDSTPSFAWGNVMSAVEAANEHTVDVVGWTNDLGIVH